MKMLQWVKQNKIIALLILLFVFFEGKNILSSVPLANISSKTSVSRSFISSPDMMADGEGGIGSTFMESISMRPPPSSEPAPTTNVKNRLVIQNSSLSLLVKNVREAADNVIAYATKTGGYMVSSTLDQPDEIPTATIVLRIPSERLVEALSVFRGLALKTTAEHLSGQDVTDQYKDNDAHLASLMRAKAKMEDIMSRAVEISDIVRIQREISLMQNQIDAVKGQQQYLEKSAQMARVTIYLATDEFALPYAPDDAWRPGVIFKYAVRSLVNIVRKGIEIAIWTGVFAVVWVPVASIAIIFYRKHKRNPVAP